MPKPLDRSESCQSWRPYVRAMADLMWLRDWTFTITNDPPPEDATAQIHLTHGRRHAVIDLSDGFLSEEDEAQQRHTVAHELIHCHLEPANIIAKSLGDDRYADFLLMYEYGVDALADAISARLPLPGDVLPGTDIPIEID